MAEPRHEQPPDWRDHVDEPVHDVPPPPGPDDPSPYLPIGAFQADGYHRNAFAQGTENEATALVELLGLEAGATVVDVGCADGRHLRALTRAGIRGVGVDVVHAAMASAPRQANVAYVQADARRLPLRTGSADAVLCLCQGGLGTSPAADEAILAELARVVRPGGTVAVTFFHALFAVRHLVPGDAFDPVHLVHHHTAEVTGPDRAVGRFPLWTSAYAVPSAAAALDRAGLEVVDVRGVEPGRYDRPGVGLDDPELLFTARRDTTPSA